MSFPLDTSLKNKYLPEPPEYISEIIKAAVTNPIKIFKKRSPSFIIHFL